MAFPKTLREVRKLIAEQEAEKKRKKVLRKSVAGFRPRKADRQSFVFLGLTGKRLPKNSTRKGFALYVNAKGKIILLSEKRGKAKMYPTAYGYKRATPRPKRPSSYSLAGEKYKRAQAKFYAGLTRTAYKTPRMIPSPIERKSRSGVKLERLAANLGADVKRTAAGYRAGKQFIIDVNFWVKIEGALEQFHFRTEFKQGDVQKLPRGTHKHYVMKLIYRFMAEELKRHDLVSVGSSRFIQRLKGNKGKPRGEWKDTKGATWEKNEMSVVKIEKIEWDILKVRITSNGNGK